MVRIRFFFSNGVFYVWNLKGFRPIKNSCAYRECIGVKVHDVSNTELRTLGGFSQNFLLRSLKALQGLLIPKIMYVEFRLVLDESLKNIWFKSSLFILKLKAEAARKMNGIVVKVHHVDAVLRMFYCFSSLLHQNVLQWRSKNAGWIGRTFGSTWSKVHFQCCCL